MPFFGVPIRNGLPIGLGSVAGFGVQQFDPSQLFAGGTAGAWYDPSDLSTLFTTSTGTTPVAMPGQGAAVPVGLMLDKSQGAPGALGAELGASLNTAGAWTPYGSNIVSASGGEISITFVGGTNSAFGASVPTSTLGLAVGKRYLFEFEVKINTGSATPYINDGASNIPFATSSTTFEKKSCRFLYTGAGIIQINNDLSSGEVITFRNFSVREIPGNHAIAFNDTTARPELRARVNLLVATATLSTQNVTTQATSYTLRFAGTGSITLSGTATGSYSAGTHTITCTAGTLTLTVSGTVTTADLRPANSGALLPAYQAVVDANTYDTSGFPLYLFFDGIDDSMYTPANLNLSGTDKISVFAGVRKLSDAVYPVIAELASDYSANNGSFALFASGSSTPRYGFYLRGSANTGYEPQTYEAPLTNVLAVSYDIGGAAKANEVLPRINGVLNQTNPVSGADAGTGNFGTYPLYIGSRNNSSLRFNGHLYGFIAAGSAVSAGNISATEQWVAGKTGIQI